MSWDAVTWSWDVCYAGTSGCMLTRMADMSTQASPPGANLVGTQANLDRIGRETNRDSVYQGGISCTRDFVCHMTNSTLRPTATNNGANPLIGRRRHPPTYYVPPNSVNSALLSPSPKKQTHCEVNPQPSRPAAVPPSVR